MSSSKTGSKSAQQDKQLQDALAEELGTGKKPERINLGDTPALKRALDDAAIEVCRFSRKMKPIKQVITPSFTDDQKRWVPHRLHTDRYQNRHRRISVRFPYFFPNTICL